MAANRFRIFFLPYAGASGYSYHPFVSASKNVECISLEIPGRGRRFKEPLLSDVNSIALDIVNQISKFDDLNFVIFGHSFGALLGFVTINLLKEKNARQPLHFFASGCAAPSRLPGHPVRHTLSEEDFFSAVQELGGMHTDILSDIAMRNYFEPILRADFKALESYVYTQPDKVNIPFTVIAGNKERITPEELQQWQEQTVYPIDIVRFEGNHFYLFDHVNDLLSLIQRKTECLRA